MSTPEPPPGFRDLSIPMEAIMRPGLVLGVVITALALGPYALLHGVDGIGRITLAMWAVGIVLIVLLLVAHELLHGIGWTTAGRFGWDDISFAIDRKTLSPYCHARVPMLARAYRIGTVLPGLVTGLIPVLAGWITGSAPLALIGAFMSTGAVGDLLILWIIRAVPGDRLVIDHPTRAGCFVQEG